MMIFNWKDAPTGSAADQHPGFAMSFPKKKIERALLNASKAGNSKAFGELLAHYEPRLQSLANEIARNRDDAQEEDLKQILNHGIRRLRPAHRIVLELRYVKELSTLRVAKSLGINLSTAKNRLRRARLELVHHVGRSLGHNSAPR
jgi:RNA polymerase sigma factor (sigma-70 family)